MITQKTVVSLVLRKPTHRQQVDEFGF